MNMETFLLLLFAVFLLYALFGKKSKKPVPVVRQQQNQGGNLTPGNALQNTKPKQASMEGEKEKKESIRSLVGSIKVTVGTGEDSAIIDVSGQAYKLPTQPGTSSVPYWPHQYVYGYNELNSATPAQKAFYQRFKLNFLNGVYLDVQGNSNYYFILLFDFLQEADNAPNLDELEKRLKALAEHYPKTASYCRSFLLRKMGESDDQAGINRLVNEGAFLSFSNDYSYYRLGSRLKNKLGLTTEEIAAVNKLTDPANSFSAIEFCLHQMVRLYLRTIAGMNKELAQENTTLEEQFTAIAGTVAKRVFHYKPGTDNFKYAVETTASELFMLLFKHCENALREHYGHKRKLNTDCNYRTEIRQELEAKVLSKLPPVLAAALAETAQPDSATEILLNEQNTTRWKIYFEKLTAAFTTTNIEHFLAEIIELGNRNKKNPFVENIFFEASKFMAKWNKEAALKLYVHYLYHDMRSAFFDRKPFTKTIQKSLFKTAEELHNFEQVVSNLIKTKDLELALKAIPAVFAPKRKKIQLDRSAIFEVSKQHSSTVNLLGEILSEEEEATPLPAVNNSQITLHVTATETTAVANLIAGLTAVQTELLELFFKSNFVVEQKEVEAFARSKALFRNGLIESVNESCYERLDDLLIEEEEDNYTMNPNYYQLITAR